MAKTVIFVYSAEYPFHLFISFVISPMFFKSLQIFKIPAIRSFKDHCNFFFKKFGFRPVLPKKPSHFAGILSFVF